MMFVLDLKWALLLLLLVTGLGASLAVWLDRLLNGRGKGVSACSIGEGTPLLEQAPFGLLLLAPRGTLRYANRYARRLLALEPATRRLPDSEWGHQLAEDRREAREDRQVMGRYRSIPISNDLHIRWWVTPWGDLDLVFIEDTTAQQRAEQNARFLISDLSHELRTPLATLLTHLEVLKLPEIPVETREQSLHLLQVETGRMSRLIHSLLELSRLETRSEFDPGVIEPLPLIEGVVVQLRPLAEERAITLSLRAATPLPLVVGERDRLRQLFLNLLDNAIKYSREGDRVEVQVEQRAAGLHCTISDSGPGIPAEHLPHITRRFYRAAKHARVEGNGLGLALATEILRRHQSRLEIESQSEGPATGTRISFTLPLLERTEAER